MTAVSHCRANRQKEFIITNVVSRSEYREILLARMAAGDLYAAETLRKVRMVDMMLDEFREKPIYGRKCSHNTLDPKQRSDDKTTKR